MRKQQGGKRGSRTIGRRADTGVSRKEQRLLLRLIMCSVLFALMVVGKLLLPQYVSELNLRISETLQRNMDIETVFSAVSRTFGGESSAAEAAKAVYRAVFLPEETHASELTVVQEEPRAALSVLQVFRVNEEPEKPELEPDEDLRPEEDLQILYSDENLPDGVSMEPRILGFSYCVPVEGNVSSAFGYREHPVEGEERFHYGLDLAAGEGTAIHCFADGIVTVAGESSSYGKYCIVAHENGCTTLYAHCSRLLTSSGSTVKMGDTIAEVGDTGIATGCHLHFELQQDQIYLNPIYYVS